jgi:hypothetical protein
MPDAELQVYTLVYPISNSRDLYELARLRFKIVYLNFMRHASLVDGTDRTMNQLAWLRRGVESKVQRHNT